MQNYNYLYKQLLSDFESFIDKPNLTTDTASSRNVIAFIVTLIVLCFVVRYYMKN